MQFLRQSTNAPLILGRFVDATDGFTPETGLTISNTDIKLLKHGSTSEVDKNAVGTAAAHLSNGWYRYTLDATDTNTVGRLNVGCYESGARGVEREYMVLPANVYDALLGSDLLDVNVAQISEDATAADNLEAAYDGAGYAGGTTKQDVNVAFWNGDGLVAPSQPGVPVVDPWYLLGDNQSMQDLKDFADAGYDPSTNKVQGVVLTDTATTVTNQVSANVTAISGDAAAADNLEAAADGTGYNLGGGSIVASSVTNTVGSVSGNVGGNVEGTVASVVGSVGSVTGHTPQTGDSYAVVSSATHGNAALKALIDTITNRIGAFTGSGVNTVLGFFQALMRSDATLPSDVGGTYDDANHSLQALAGAVSSGPGPWAVVVNVKSGATNLQNADVLATNGSEEYTVATDSSGNATFAIPTDSWDFYAYKPNYVQQSAPLTIAVSASTTSGNNITMTYDPPGQSLTEEDPTMTATFLTMHDVACHLRDMLGGADGEEDNRAFRRAIRLATDDFFSEDGLKESLVEHRVVVQDSYATGTIAFDLTGGSSERLITLTDGTFPSWAGRASIIIDNEHYRVTSRLSDSTVQLDETLCPTADVASGTSYTLYQDAYLLPADFGALYSPVDKNGWDRRYVSEEDWLRLTTESRIGDDYRYTIMHDDRVPGRYALRFYGYPTESRTLTFLYKRKRKTPVLAGTETNSSVGTIAYTNGSATITGTNTVFSDAMVGAVLRIGDATNVPTDAAGDYPYLEEHVIGAVASATSLTLKTAVGLTTGSGKKYRISDPVTFDRGNQLALLKGAEAQYHELVNSSADNVRDARMAYERAKVRCRDDQSKHRSSWSPVSGSSHGAGRPSINVNAPS